MKWRHRCPWCGRAFKNPGSLAIHKRDIHCSVSKPDRNPK